MSNYSKVSVANDPRTELHDQLGLTGAEISINHLPAGASVPFVHYSTFPADICKQCLYKLGL